jgi:hypothetical protein
LLHKIGCISLEKIPKSFVNVTFIATRSLALHGLAFTGPFYVASFVAIAANFCLPPNIPILGVNCVHICLGL